MLYTSFLYISRHQNMKVCMFTDVSMLPIVINEGEGFHNHFFLFFFSQIYIKCPLTCF